MKKHQLLFLVLTLTAMYTDHSYALSGGDLVKLSKALICHPPESPYYDRVKDTYEGELTLEECLGLTEPKAKIMVKKEEVDLVGRLPNILQPLWNAQKLEKAAEDAEDDEAVAVAQEMKAKAKAKIGEEEEGFKNFGGLRFGLGIGMTFLGEQIDEVRIIDGQIAVTKERSNQGRVILESHKFIWGLADSDKGRLTDKWAFGPFVAAALADDQGQGLLSAYGAGIMAGYRTEGSSRSWNIGLGWFVDTEVTVLRPGFSDGMDVTQTDSADLTKAVDEEGLMILVSGSW